MIEFKNFHLGETESRHPVEGTQGGFDKLTNVDIHSVVGQAQCQLAMEMESTTPTEPGFVAQNAVGTTYIFSDTSGSIWRRGAAGGAYSLAHTNTNGAHRGAQRFGNYIYYFSTGNVGRFDLSSTWTDSWATFDNGGNYHPSQEVNNTLFIGDGKQVASVNSAGTFSANALDIPPGLDLCSFAPSGTDLLMGTYGGEYTATVRAYLWDTYSSSWLLEDVVNEIGINNFILADNVIYAQCGNAGALYYWTGSKFEYFKRIRNVTPGTGYQKPIVFNGKPVIVIHDEIYSIYRANNQLPVAIAQEYTTTVGACTALFVVQNNLFAITNAGVNYIGTDRATATIDTQEATGNFQNVIVNYDTLPAGTSIGIATQVDHAGSYTSQTVVTDTINKRCYFNGGLGDVNSLQGEITLTPSGANTPIIKSIIFD